MIVNNKREIISLQELIKTNEIFKEQYKNNALIKLIDGDSVENIRVRERLLDSIQVFSNYFQKVVMLRSILCEDKDHKIIANLHLAEEFQHNLLLDSDRKARPVIWDPILEATSAWFVWKMFTTNNEEKAAQIHLVLEASANIFFQKANLVMTKFGETKYFNIHDELDSHHENLAHKLFENLSCSQYKAIYQTLEQSWSMVNAACERIAYIANNYCK